MSAATKASKITNRTSVLKRLRSGVLALSLLALQVASPVATAFALSNPAQAAAATTQPSIVTNPSLATSCGLDIAIVIDNSSSISNSEMNQMKSAMTAFTNALNGTPTEFSVTRFATNATVTQNFTSNVTTVNNAINAVPTGGGYTNWEDGFQKAASTLPNRSNPNLVIFASDGDPTESSAGQVDTDQPNAHLNPAITQANAIKSSGTRVLALGIGSPTVSRLQAISGPNVNTGNVLTSDVITTDFNNLAAELAAFANQTCGGTITTTKLIDADGNANTTNDRTVASGWSFDVNGSPSDPAATVTDASGKTPAVKVNNGTYSVNEVAQAGYDLLSASCTGAANNGSKQGNAVTGLTVATNNIISCTFVNAASRGSVQVNKMLDADGNGTYEGGNSEAQAKNMFWKLDGGATTTFGGNIGNVTTGSHQVTEVMPAGYHFTGWFNTFNQQQSCTNPAGTTLPINVTVSANLTSQITLCNARDTGTIKVKKVVVNNNGGKLTPSAFSMHLTGEGIDVAGSPVAGSNSGTSFEVKTGTYTVSENTVAGYAQTSLVCTDDNTQAVVANPVVLGSNQHVTCVVTNDDIAPTVTVVKNVVNPFGTPLPASAFGLFVDGQVVYSGISTNQFDAGHHTVSENQQSGYTLTDVSGDCKKDGDIANLMLSLDGNATCTLTNTAIQPKLIVTKVVINDNSGEKEASDFEMTISGNSANPANFPGNEWGQSVGLNEGNYSVNEVNHDGYTQSFSGNCSGIIAIGQTKYCTITNDDIAHPSISVEKYGQPTAHEGETVWYTFYVTNTGDTKLSNVSVSDDIAIGETCDDTELGVGESTYCYAYYQIPAGQTANVVNTVTVRGDSPNETTVTDTDNHTLDVLHPSIKVEKSGPATGKAGSKVEYTFTVTNTGDVSLDNLTVEDTLTGSGVYVSGDTNDNQVLEVSETWIFKGTYTIPAAQTTNVVNTVDVCGYEPYNNEEEVIVDAVRVQAIIKRKPSACASDTHTLTLTKDPVVLSNTTAATPAVLGVTGQQGYTTLLISVAFASSLWAGVVFALTRRKTTN